MADIVSPAVRSRMMSGIRSANTKPEIMLRKGLHALGFRFRLHDRKLPGTPDIIFPRYRAVVFAHGCFWHGHDCHLYRLPATRPEFWLAKIERNRLMDAKADLDLQAAAWRRAVIWECALRGRTRRDYAATLETLATWLKGGTQFLEIEGSR